MFNVLKRTNGRHSFKPDILGGLCPCLGISRSFKAQTERDHSRSLWHYQKDETKADETVLEEEVETSEASETDLESVEETEEVAIAEAVGEDDPAESLRAQASEWLGSVLQSVPKEN